MTLKAFWAFWARHGRWMRSNEISIIIIDVVLVAPTADFYGAPALIRNVQAQYIIVVTHLNKTFLHLVPLHPCLPSLPQLFKQHLCD